MVITSIHCLLSFLSVVHSSLLHNGRNCWILSRNYVVFFPCKRLMYDLISKRGYQNWQWSVHLWSFDRVMLYFIDLVSKETDSFLDNFILKWPLCLLLKCIRPFMCSICSLNLPFVPVYFLSYLLRQSFLMKYLEK